MTRHATEIMPRATIVQIVGLRNRVLEQATTIFEAIDRVNDLAKGLNPQKSYLVPSLAFDRGYRDRIGSPEGYRKALDAAAWHHVMERTGLRDLMGHRQKEEWRDRLEQDPPEFTIENVTATFETMAAQAGDIFLKSVVDVFERLPRDFRSHDGFKLGTRCVLTAAVSNFIGRASWLYTTHYNRRDMLDDLDRAFHRLAGKTREANASDIADLAMREGKTECETTFFRLRWFRNGNMHVWMTDRKVVEDANRLLAQHYGDRLGWMHLHPDERRAA